MKFIIKLTMVLTAITLHISAYGYTPDQVIVNADCDQDTASTRRYADIAIKPNYSRHDVTTVYKWTGCLKCLQNATKQSDFYKGADTCIANGSMREITVACKKNEPKGCPGTVVKDKVREVIQEEWGPYRKEKGNIIKKVFLQCVANKKC